MFRGQPPPHAAYMRLYWFPHSNAVVELQLSAHLSVFWHNMKKLFHVRSRVKLKSNGAEAHIYDQSLPKSAEKKASIKLPARVLKHIFAYLCPHTNDETCTSLEGSMIEAGCMLCSMRDLAHCASVSHEWTDVTQRILLVFHSSAYNLDGYQLGLPRLVCRYRSVRLDPVHYCQKEYDLSAKRKRRSFFERNGDPKDPTQERLQLFERTVRENEYLAALVQILKMPYMTRQTCKADLARTVSVLPNLRYVDLPEGFFNDEPSSSMLRQELQHRCPEIRSMKYHAGAESSFALLAHSRIWQNLEILELVGLEIEPDTLLYVVASLPDLREVKLGDIPSLDDTIFGRNNSLPPFPPLSSLILEGTPAISASGLIAYLSRPEVRELLSRLSLSKTGVLPQDLHEVLSYAPRLSDLTINEIVSRSFPLKPVPALASRSLLTFHYEILSSSHSPNPPSDTYYTYLASSLLSSSLPSLRYLYAFSPSLPALLLIPPNAPFAGSNKSSRFSAASSIYSNSSQSGAILDAPLSFGLTSRLSIYTKPPEAIETEWSLTTIEPPSEQNGRRGSASATRPISVMASDRSGSPNSGSGRSKDSVLVGNGFGGYLAVPSEDSGGRGRLGSSHIQRASHGSEWMG